jgi:hypothetical protein
VSTPSEIPPAAPTRDQLRNRRKREVRKTTLNPLRAPKGELRRLALLVPELTPEELAMRPRTRGDCENGLRPCPWVSCRHHLFLDVTKTGSLTLHFPDLEVEQLVETCALDVADLGGETLEGVGELSNCTRERIRQIEARALTRLQRRGTRVLREFATGEDRRPVRVLREEPT